MEGGLCAALCFIQCAIRFDFDAAGAGPINTAEFCPGP
jgi:hypothetical protein